jgi:hypothetical protein
MGIDPKGCFLGGMGGRSLATFQGLEKVGFLKIRGIILLMVWDGVFGENRWVCYFCLFFFCRMVI